MISIEQGGIQPYIEDGALHALRPRTEAAHHALVDGSGAGSEFLGWRALLRTPDFALLDDVAATAARIRKEADVFLCIGIGGSYLGAKAVIDALTPYFNQDGPEIIFAGHHMSGDYHRELVAYLEGKSVFVNVISKSGTTLEPALAFRLVREWMARSGADLADRVIITTDPERGALNELRKTHAFKKYIIPPSVGGRFSVLSPVGLLPIAVAGIDIHALFGGAKSAFDALEDPAGNVALSYASARYLLLQGGYVTELLAVFEPRLASIGGWWQQLYGESEGKERKGLFPVTVQYSTDLHSLGQYVQQGIRNLSETFLMVRNDAGDQTIPGDESNLDGLNYLTGKTFTHINRKAYEGTARAHSEGSVPNMTLWMDDVSPHSIGELIYFFEHAVAVSGYLQDLNPFDQPGVEAYKKEMFRLLGKPK